MLRCESLCYPDVLQTGGHALFERQWQGSSGEELEDKQPELFDIHVMMFADRSDAAVVELQRTFALERAAAERLLDEAPLVVKRAATPEVAAALIDALGQMGAQVVILPSSAQAPSDPPSSAQAPSDPPSSAQAPSNPPRAAELTPKAFEEGSAAWGGLNLAPAPASPPADDEAAIRAAGRARYERAQARARELEREREEAQAVERRSAQAQPRAQRAVGGDDESEQEFALGDEQEDVDAADGLPALEQDSGLEIQRNTVSDAPARGASVSRAPAPPPARTGAARPPGTRPASQPRLDLVEPNARRAPAPPPARPPGKPAPGVSPALGLGLGPVPPLPRLQPARAAVATPAPKPAPARAATPARAAAAPARRASGPVEPARTQARSGPREDPSRATVKGAEPSRRDKGMDDYWSARRAAAEPAARPPVQMPIAAPATLPRPGEASAAVHAVLTATTEKPQRSRGLAAGEMLAGVLVFAGGIYMDNSVLAGSATPASIVVHGFAVFGILTGLWGLRP